MQLPEPFWNMWLVRGGAYEDVCGYEHSVSVMLPWRKYRQHFTPKAVDGSPSHIELGEQDRHGTQLAVTRKGLMRTLTEVEQAEMLGELVEAWVSMTLIPSS